MARSCSCYAVMAVFLVMLASMVSSMDARKLLMSTHEERKGRVWPNWDASSVLNALPKGPSPPKSSPSGKGHAVIIGEKLFARHIGSPDRIMNSVPSPGAGH
ncbi:precursor of CEP14 [Malania oleifera]|uniref:precursor of CEP14 n=1 Tax=Malania oleifera TaxID=397392 RepID=UPI0025AE1966|nr:precursor of CEP14 [Malania oleifera]